MKKNIRTILPILCVGVLWIGLSLVSWFGPAKTISEAERRNLDQFPALSLQTIQNGSFMDKFSGYARDQFPFRDFFRSLKAEFHYNVLAQKENNRIFYYDGYAGELQYPLNQKSVDYALNRFQFVYDKYLQNGAGEIYTSVIPDKGYYLPSDSGYPTMDYGTLFASVIEGMPWAKYIDITDTLSLQDYYYTDIHWRQERIVPVAAKLLQEMGMELQSEFAPILGTDAFRGVYYGQSALPLPCESIYLMQNKKVSDVESWQDYTVLNHESGMNTAVYDMEKLTGRDPYEVFLSGSVSLMTVNNPNHPDGKELIVFRDSFASSLIPLIAESYRSITLVDIRYLSPALLDRFLDVHGQDVLFLYSVPVLNHSETLK